MKNSIMGYICLKLIESNKWEKALAVYKSNPQLNVNVKNKKGLPLIEVLLPNEYHYDWRGNEKIKDEMLKIFISSIRSSPDDVLLKYGVTTCHHNFDNVALQATFIIYRILSTTPHLAPDLFKSLNASPNKAPFWDYILHKTFELNNEALMRLAMKYYSAEKTLPFPIRTLSLYFNLTLRKVPPIIKMEDFIDCFKNKGIDYSSFLLKKDFHLFHEYINDTASLMPTQDTSPYHSNVAQEIISYYKAVKSLGFNPIGEEEMEEGPPINLLEHCFLNSLYLSTLALSTVYPEIFCNSKQITTLRSWMTERSVDQHCVLHPSFPKNRLFTRDGNVKTLEFVKNHFDILQQKMELENLLSLTASSTNSTNSTNQNSKPNSLKV